jgi:hypothetical protein
MRLFWVLNSHTLKIHTLTTNHIISFSKKTGKETTNLYESVSGIYLPRPRQGGEEE